MGRVRSLQRGYSLPLLGWLLFRSQTGHRGSKEIALLAHGINQGDKRAVPHLILEGWESIDFWKSVLHDLEDREIKPPQLIISDDNLGLLRNICDVWPEVPTAVLHSAPYVECAGPGAKAKAG